MIKFDHAGKTVLITGATSGIGREVAIRFGDSGATVINADIEVEPNEASKPTHEQIEADGGSAEYVKTDISKKSQLETTVEAARGYGGVDVMINNAGLQVPGPFREVTEKDLRATHDINVFGTFFDTQIAAEDMSRRDEPGVIINTASISSNNAQFEKVQYDSSKGAVRVITRGTALELAEHGIRVNGVAPGQIATEFILGWSEEAPRAVESDDLLKPVPLGRAGTLTVRGGDVVSANSRVRSRKSHSCWIPDGVMPASQDGGSSQDPLVWVGSPGVNSPAVQSGAQTMHRGSSALTLSVSAIADSNAQG